jgi:hypothetical protein
MNKLEIETTVWIPRKFWLVRGQPGIFKPQMGHVIESFDMTESVKVDGLGPLEFEKMFCYLDHGDCQAECDRLNERI